MMASESSLPEGWCWVTIQDVIVRQVKQAQPEDGSVVSYIVDASESYFTRLDDAVASLERVKANPSDIAPRSSRRRSKAVGAHGGGTGYVPARQETIRRRRAPPKPSRPMPSSNSDEGSGIVVVGVVLVMTKS